MTLPPLPEPDITAYVTDSAMRSLKVRAHSDRQLQAYARSALAAVPAQPVSDELIESLWYDAQRAWGEQTSVHPGEHVIFARLLERRIAAAPQAVPVPAGWSVTYDGKRASYIYADQETAEFEAQQVGGTARAVAVYLAAAPKEQPHE